VMGFRAEISLMDGLKEVIDWMRMSKSPVT
jgi:nucleoside-diphosphate-sugar epimerase